MNIKKFLLLVLFFSTRSFSYAQDSMLEGFSYLYLEKLVATAKENYPRVKFYNSQVNNAKSKLAGQKISWLEPISFSYIFRSNSTIDIVSAELFSGYQVGVSVNPGSLLQKPSQIKSAREDVKAAEYEQAEYDLHLEAEVKSRYIAYLQSLNALKLLTRSTLDAESIFRDVKARYEKNEITFQEYNNASISLTNSIQSKIQAEANMLTAKVTLEELLVKKLEEIK